MKSHIALWFCMVLVIIDSKPRLRRNFNEDGDCQSGWSCVSPAICLQTLKDLDTAFPCSNYGTGILKVCCPNPDEDGTVHPDQTSEHTTEGIKTTRTSTTVTKPTSRTTIKTTTTPKPSSSDLQDFTELWDSFSENLRDKVALLPSSCGAPQVANRILNGEDAILGEFPWMALVGYEEKGVKKFFCGGSLINDRYILTAAHCAKVETIIPTIIRLGEWNLATDEDCPASPKAADECDNPVQDIPIDEIIKHESFGNRSLPLLRFDIALIRLASPASLSIYIQPICLSPVVFRNNKERYVIAGWGVTENLSRRQSPVLQYTQVLLFDFNECNAIAPAEVSPLLRKTQFCAGGSDEQDACKGDSGGPLSYILQNRHFLKGIVSLATSSLCGQDARPTVYTEVASFTKWILKKMKP